MNNYLKFAWRNVWRNKRRTIITSSSVMFAVFFCIIFQGFTIGFYDQVVKNITQSYLGNIQIHAKGYWDDKTMDNTFENTAEIDKILSENKNIKSFTNRIESFAFASSGESTKGALIIGTDINKTAIDSKLQDKIVSGSLLTENDNGVMLSEGLAKYLKIQLNDTLVLLSEGYHGVSAAGKYPVRCIIHFSTTDLDNQLIYMNLSTAQEFYSLDKNISSLVINLTRPKQVEKEKKLLAQQIDTSKYEIMTWSEVAPELDGLIKSEENNSIIFVAILYLIIGFGIFGTVLMLTNERKREFGVMVAVGMGKKKLALLTWIEILFMGMIGIVAGLAISLPVVYHFYIHPYVLEVKSFVEITKNYGFEPLLPLAWEADYIISQCLVVILFFMVSSLYPIVKILQLEVIQALRK